MSAIRSIRLPEELDEGLRLVAHIEGVSVNGLVVDAIAEKLRERRTDPDFGARLRDRIAADQRILDQLAGQKPG